MVAQFTAPPAGLAAHAAATYGAKLRSESASGRLTLFCPKDKVAPLADWLVGRGAANVTVAALDYVFSPINPLFERLTARLR